MNRLAVNDPRIEQSVRQQFDLALGPQLNLLPRPNGYVSASGASGLGMASGYLLAACECIIERHGFDPKTSPYFAMMLGHAFQSVYGPAGEQIGLDSFEAVRRSDPAILAGQRAGRQDMIDFAESGQQPMGFVTIAGAGRA